MEPDYLEIAAHLGSAWLAGSLIGLERSFHGRPAGFRTHALVCLASALLMVFAAHQWKWVEPTPLRSVTTDPTRMAQGIMTGIGFLGAGVIFKDGLTIRGLTTAASIWVTAALGILYGVGLYFPAVAASLATLGTLAAFRWIEYRIPTETYVHHVLGFAKDRAMPEAQVRALMAEHGFSIASMSYRLNAGGTLFEYRMTMSTLDKTSVERLAARLQTMGNVTEFRLSPSSD